VYIYQFKINVKAAFGGDVWQWHQDYIFWRNEDGMPGTESLMLLSSSMT
jgi:ectoine hydroxylase